jgi:ABC-type multidrug transport system fused ATPase/permease subunit
MFKIVKHLFSILKTSQRRQFYLLQVLVIVMSLTQIVGVASIVPFMALVGDVSQLQQDNFIAEVYRFSGLTSESQFVFWLGLGVLIMLIIASIISMFTTWRITLFANKISVEIADRLFTHYLNQDWLFHASGSSAQLTKQIATETLRINHGILMPFMHLNANVVFVLSMSISIFIFDPIVAIVGVVIFALSYSLIFKLVSITLLKNGRSISEMYEKRYRLMNEGFGGIKDVLLLGRHSDFIDRFYKTGVVFAYSQGVNNALGHVPRYFMELIAFGSMIGLVLYLFTSYDADLSSILPILSVYAIAGMKLLPAFQGIYNSLASIKASTGAYEAIRQDLIDSSEIKPTINKFKASKKEKSYLNPKNRISLENVSFRYPGKNELVLNQLNISIPVKKIIGIVGPSGSGKSTLVDILLGLIEPQKGSLKIDGAIINNQNRRSWQNSIGFVAQAIFLSEGTIAENVAFGLSKDQINFNQVDNALKLANLEEFVKDLKNGVHTKVGERGVQLSGGQRQRIGIARALYHQAEILVFDEATSSLDGITEKMIMQAVHKFSNEKTIIMIAHRLKTIEKCDQIFFIDEGKVADQGTFQELIEKNEKFKNMANHT